MKTNGSNNQTLYQRMEHLAEHIGDDDYNLPLMAKNDVLLAAKALALVDEWYDAREANRHCHTYEVSRTRARYMAAQKALKEFAEARR